MPTPRYEDGSYRMLKGLAPLGQVTHFAELGELNDLVELIGRIDERPEQA
jgi:hypothetical protein